MVSVFARITLLKTQGYNTYLNLAKQRFKCLECNGTFTAKTSIVDESCFISRCVTQKVIEEATKVKTEIDTAEDNCISPSTFFNDTATTEIYTRKIVGSVRCV
ncbi:hypothetical protein JMUB7523_26280 [Staphylococcus aureus]